MQDIISGLGESGMPSTKRYINDTYIKIYTPSEFGISYVCRRRFPCIILFVILNFYKAQYVVRLTTVEGLLRNGWLKDIRNWFGEIGMLRSKGCINGTYNKITMPTVFRISYICSKSFPCIVLQVIVNSFWIFIKL